MILDSAKKLPSTAEVLKAEAVNYLLPSESAVKHYIENDFKVKDPQVRGDKADIRRNFKVNLHVQRHGRSKANELWEAGVRDAFLTDPILTGTGHAGSIIAACNFIHRVIQGQAFLPDIVLSSPLNRAVETYQKMAWAFELFGKYFNPLSGRPSLVYLEALKECQDDSGALIDTSRDLGDIPYLQHELSTTLNNICEEVPGGELFKTRIQKVADLFNLVGALITARTGKAECNIWISSHIYFAQELTRLYLNTDRLDAIGNCEVRTFSLDVKTLTDSDNPNYALEPGPYHYTGGVCPEPAIQDTPRALAESLDAYCKTNGFDIEGRLLMEKAFKHMVEKGEPITADTDWCEVFKNEITSAAV